MKIPVIIDLDPREDLSFPLLFLSADPAYELKAVTFSLPPANAAEDEERRAFLSSLGLQVPAVCGNDLSAVRLMSETIRDSGGPVALVLCGSLHNAAALLLTQPELREKLLCIAFAGGGFRGGDATTAAERNVYDDPEAADVVLRSGAKILMAPLELNAAVEGKESLSSYVGNLCHALRQEMPELPMEKGSPLSQGRLLRNICAASAVAHPELFRTRDLYVEAELSGALSRGSTVADFKGQWEKKANVSVLEGLNPEGLLSLLSSLPTPAKRRENDE